MNSSVVQKPDLNNPAKSYQKGGGCLADTLLTLRKLQSFGVKTLIPLREMYKKQNKQTNKKTLLNKDIAVFLEVCCWDR